MTHFIKHWYIPHESNEFRPYGMRHTTLHWITGIVLFAKVGVLVTLFFLYPNSAYFSTITSSKIIELTNIERAKKGSGKVFENSLLTIAATEKLKDMLARDYFSHTSPDGTKAWEQISNAGYNYTYAGENLAMNFFSAEEVVDAWMKSESHRENLLSDNYEDIGIAVDQGKINGQGVTVIVQLFGKTYAPQVPLFGRTGSSVLGVVSGNPQIAGGTEEVTIRAKAFSLQTLVKNKNLMRVFGVLVLVGVLFLALHEKKLNRMMLAHGLLVLVIILLALVIQPHFLEGITGNLVIL